MARERRRWVLDAVVLPICAVIGALWLAIEPIGVADAFLSEISTMQEICEEPGTASASSRPTRVGSKGCDESWDEE